MKERLRLAGGTEAGTPPTAPGWALQEAWEALAARVVTMEPEAVTILLEGAKRGDQRSWFMETLPPFQGLTIGHAQVMGDLSLGVRPDPE